MSPRPVDDLPDDDPIPMPTRGRPGTTEPSAEPVGEVSLPEEILTPTMPITRARVVYLGPGEHHAISIPGQIHETYLEDPDGSVTRHDRDGTQRTYTVIKAAVDTGITQYDFTSRDAVGRLIPERMMPEGVMPSRLAKRPFTWCEHIGHLRQFYFMRDARGEHLYHVMVRQADVPRLQDHIRKSERQRRQQEQLFSDVTTR